jgi:hypothetical protein
MNIRNCAENVPQQNQRQIAETISCCITHPTYLLSGNRYKFIPVIYYPETHTERRLKPLLKQNIMVCQTNPFKKS